MILNQETDHDVVKVLDFGLVKSFMPDSGQFPADVSLTQAGVILGSPQYMAPEQARNISDPRSDVYSLGVVLYQMLLGRPPFHAEQGIDIIVKHINEPPPAFSAIWPQHTIPPEVEALVMKCLAKRPADRFDSMDAVIESMRRAMTSAGISGVYSGPRAFGTSPGSGPLTGPIAPPPVQTASPSGASTMSLDISVEEPEVGKRRNSLPMALFGGAVLVGVGVALVLALRTSTPKPPPVLPTVPAPTAVAPTPTPAPPPPEPQQPAEAPQHTVALSPEDLAPLPVPTKPAPPEPVVFRITSEPSGARVTYAGKSLGQTPVELKVPPDAEGHASARLTFELAGYTSVTATPEGEGPEVHFSQRLKKKTSSRPAKAPGSSGYKDDPYQ
jgi:serine/threonine-protein kinase